MTDISGRVWFRNLIFILTQPFLPPSGVLPAIIHEASHWLVALAAGVPTSEILLLNYGLNPAVVIPSTINPAFLPYFFYAGGLVSGTFLLLVYVFYWVRLFRRSPSAVNWMLSMTTVIAMTLQFYLGILEGKYRQAYGGHIVEVYLALWIVIGVAAHAVIFHLVTRRKKVRI